MKENKSEVVVILDRSGSMQSCRSDMEGALRHFLRKQKEDVKSNGQECNLTFVKFDDRIDTVFENEDINNVGESRLSLEPRGMTALLDALGKTINSVGERLKDTPESERPSSVVVVVITDGLENASCEFTKPTISNMIKEQQEKYSWEFIYLGADHDAISEGSNYGFQGGKTMTYSKDPLKMQNLGQTISSSVSALRAGEDYNFTAKDRKNVGD